MPWEATAVVCCYRLVLRSRGCMGEAQQGKDEAYIDSDWQ